jgi:TnpA family transposase
VARYFLNEFQRQKLESYPEMLIKEDMFKFFTLTENDKNFIKGFRGDSNKLGVAIQICCICFIGFIPEDFYKLNKSFLRYVAKQLDLSFHAFFDYAVREQTRTEHLAKALTHLGYSYYDEKHEQSLQNWLNSRAMEHDSSTVLLCDSLKKIHQEKYLRPALTTLEKCVSIARMNALKATYSTISHLITRNNKRIFNKILSQHDEIENTTYLRWLSTREVSNSIDSMKSSLSKIEFLKLFKINQWNAKDVNPNRQRFLARIAKRSSPSALDKSEEKKKFQVIVFFLMEVYGEIVDELIDIFITIMFDKLRQSKRQVRELREKHAKSINEKVLAFITMGRIHLNPGIRDAKVRKKTFEKIPREKLQRMIQECKIFIRPKDNSVWDFYVKKYSQIKQFYPEFIKHIQFYSDENARMKSLPKAISILRRVCSGGWDCIPKNAPIDFINKSWSQFVFDKNGSINKKYYELCVLWNLRLGLKSGEIWTDRGKKYTNPDSWLIPIAKWNEIKAEYLKVTEVEAVATVKIKELREQVNLAKMELDKNIQSGKDVRLENKKIIISPVKAKEVIQSVEELGALVSYYMPRVDLTEIIIEAASWIAMSECFTHAGGDDSRIEPRDFMKRLYACLFAQGCNVELSKMAEHSGCSESDLVWFNTWYLREDCVMAASNKAVNFQFNNPFSRHYGGGELSSSDGKRESTPVKSKKSASIVKYFAYGKGVTLYSWTSDQFTQFGSKVNSPIERDSPYVLDALCDNETLLPIREHTTDTSGFTDLTFAMFDLVGIRFSPRIKDLAKYKLYGFRSTERDESDPSFGLFSSETLKERSIINNWDGMQRFAASVKFGYIPASLLMTRILAYSKRNSVTKALVEHGKCIRTLHSIRCMNDINHRRDMQKQLNKGENLNNLRGFLRFGNSGEMRKSQEESQSCQAACITLLSNLVIIWNTKYIEIVINELKKSGKVIRDKDIQYITPCRFGHINKYGKYNFELENGLKNGQFRRIKID